MRRLVLLFLGLALFGPLHSPALGQDKKEKFKEPPIIPVHHGPSFKHLDGQMLVFAVNGVGGSTHLSDNLIEVNGAKRLGLRIQMIPWCRHNSIFADLTDQEAQVNAAAKIACSVNAIRKDAPNAHIFFVAHSAGARVVLTAAEMLPPKSLDRIILLHPAVPCTYDLTAALRASRYGIDNFYSPEDGVLASAEQHPASAEAVKPHAAGRLGFRLVSADKADAAAYRAVRHHRWNEDFCGSGGHYSWTHQHNMKKVLPPLFFSAPVIYDLPIPMPIVIEKKEGRKLPKEK